MEWLDVVDEDGNPTGRVVERGEAHLWGIPHRTAHVWLARRHEGRIQILLQQRSLQKESWPGCYDISSAGHIPAGCDYAESAIRELAEELGIEASSDELIYCGDRRFVFEYTHNGTRYTDRQTSRVFVIYRDTDECDMILQSDEVDSVMWIDFDECLTAVRNNSFRHCIAE